MPPDDHLGHRLPVELCNGTVRNGEELSVERNERGESALADHIACCVVSDLHSASRGFLKVNDCVSFAWRAFSSFLRPRNEK